MKDIPKMSLDEYEKQIQAIEDSVNHWRENWGHIVEEKYEEVHAYADDCPICRINSYNYAWGYKLMWEKCPFVIYGGNRCDNVCSIWQAFYRVFCNINRRAEQDHETYVRLVTTARAIYEYTKEVLYWWIEHKNELVEQKFPMEITFKIRCADDLRTLYHRLNISTYAFARSYDEYDYRYDADKDTSHHLWLQLDDFIKHNNILKDM